MIIGNLIIGGLVFILVNLGYDCIEWWLVIFKLEDEF